MSISQPRKLFAIIIWALILQGCAESTPPENNTVSDPATVVNEIADLYYSTTLDLTPEVAYFSGLSAHYRPGTADRPARASPRKWISM